ncbi:MAG: RidA family protein [Rhodobiaceae bacterium]|nr:RidA family protein [Rhodobiaceae bacterium]
MSEITRYPGIYKGRNKAVSATGFVWSVGTGEGGTVAEQTRNTLATIEANLKQAGSDKTRIVEATVYLTDMDTKQEMDDVWCDWIGEHGPCRACVGTELAHGHRVEIKVLALKG